jgi:hypothetical protein
MADVSSPVWPSDPSLRTAAVALHELTRDQVAASSPARSAARRGAVVPAFALLVCLGVVVQLRWGSAGGDLTETAGPSAIHDITTPIGVRDADEAAVRASTSREPVPETKSADDLRAPLEPPSAATDRSGPSLSAPARVEVTVQPSERPIPSIEADRPARHAGVPRAPMAGSIGVEAVGQAPEAASRAASIASSQEGTDDDRQLPAAARTRRDALDSVRALRLR